MTGLPILLGIRVTSRAILFATDQGIFVEPDAPKSDEVKRLVHEIADVVIVDRVELVKQQA